MFKNELSQFNFVQTQYRLLVFFILSDKETRNYIVKNDNLQDFSYTLGHLRNFSSSLLVCIFYKVPINKRVSVINK